MMRDSNMRPELLIRTFEDSCKAAGGTPSIRSHFAKCDLGKTTVEIDIGDGEFTLSVTTDRSDEALIEEVFGYFREVSSP